jgi:hypothetical protein
MKLTEADIRPLSTKTIGTAKDGASMRVLGEVTLSLLPSLLLLPFVTSYAVESCRRRCPSARSTRSESPTSPARLLDFSAALGPNVVVSSAVMICFLKTKAAAPAAMTAAAITPKIVARIMSVQFCPLSPFSSCCFSLIW